MSTSQFVKHQLSSNKTSVWGSLNAEKELDKLLEKYGNEPEKLLRMCQARFNMEFVQSSRPELPNMSGYNTSQNTSGNFVAPHTESSGIIKITTDSAFAINNQFLVMTLKPDVSAFRNQFVDGRTYTSPQGNQFTYDSNTMKILFRYVAKPGLKIIKSYDLQYFNDEVDTVEQSKMVFYNNCVINPAAMHDFNILVGHDNPAEIQAFDEDTETDFGYFPKRGYQTLKSDLDELPLGVPLFEFFTQEQRASLLLNQIRCDNKSGHQLEYKFNFNPLSHIIYAEIQEIGTGVCLASYTGDQLTGCGISGSKSAKIFTRYIYINEKLSRALRGKLNFKTTYTYDTYESFVLTPDDGKDAFQITNHDQTVEKVIVVAQSEVLRNDPDYWYIPGAAIVTENIGHVIPTAGNSFGARFSPHIQHVSPFKRIWLSHESDDVTPKEWSGDIASSICRFVKAQYCAQSRTGRLGGSGIIEFNPSYSILGKTTSLYNFGTTTLNLNYELKDIAQNGNIFVDVIVENKRFLSLDKNGYKFSHGGSCPNN